MDIINNYSRRSSIYSSIGEAKRGNWASKTEFILSCLGYAIGIGNVWRFPYLCYRNGGGAFLVPYLLMLFLCGIPLFFMETSLGQFASTGCITIFKICPLFKGAGYAIVIINIICTTYYNVILAYPLMFIINIFQSKLPWIDCNNSWNTKDCLELSGRSRRFADYNQSEELLLLNKTFKTPADEFFHNHILQISDSIETMGSIVWPLFVCNVISWMILYLCIMNGVKSVGKVVYFTATFPFVILSILLIRGITLPGAINGILFYVTPDWKQLTNLRIWADAAVQIFYSLGPGWGGILNMASYNNFRNNNEGDSVLVAVLNCGTSIFAGFAVFSIIGFMAHETGMPVSSVATGGPGLAFVTYPEAIAMLPLPHLWALLFFMMLYLLGVDSCFVQIEAIISSVTDEYPKLRAKKKTISFLSCFFMFLGSIMCITNGGMYVLQLLDWYAASVSVIFVCIIEVVIVGWLYGVNNFVRDVEFMLQKKITFIWPLCWKYITPIILAFIFFTTILYNTPVSYNGRQYPAWTITAGWSIAMLSMMCVPIYMIYKLIISKGSFLVRIRKSVRCTNDWGPEKGEIRNEWNHMILFADRFVLEYFEQNKAPFDFDREFDEVDVFDIAESCYYLLEADVNYFRNKWPWSKFIDWFFYKPVSDNVFWYAAHSVGLLFNLNEQQLNKILEDRIRDRKTRIECEIYALKRRFLFVNKNVNQKDILRQLFNQENSIININGIYFRKSSEFNDANFLQHFILVDSTKQNCKKIALGLAAGKTVLLQGPVGSAKTSLLEYFAVKTGKILGTDYFKIQLGDQIDSKSLLGTYHCTQIPGEFVWRPGLLTQAVVNGYWLLLEDIDCANLDVVTIINSLLENKSFNVQGYSDCLPIHPRFRLLLTQRLIPSSSAALKINLIENHVFKVHVEVPSQQELETIILKLHPIYKSIVTRMIEVYQVFTEISPQENTRLFSIRDLFKWCSRSANSYLNNPSAIGLLQNALDVFIFSFPSREARFKYSKAIFNIFGLPDSQAEYFLTTYTPLMERNLKYVQLSRVKLERNDASTIIGAKYESNFAITRQSAVQLEQIGYCVHNNEPVLLVGETGTGKTASIQFLAEQLGRKLIVINMNQQSDSKDLLGGYKPVDIKIMIRPIKNEFIRLYNSKNSTKKLYSIKNVTKVTNELYNEGRWLEMLKAMKKITKNCPEFSDDFRNSLKNFERILKHANKMMFAFIEGSLIRAIENGDWVLLDEINLATAETLECLSSLLDDRNDNIILLEMAEGKTSIRKHDNFRLFACMNPATDVGKRDLPIGLRNRFTEFYIEELTDEKDLLEMVRVYLKNYNLGDLLKAIVDFYLKIRQDSITVLSDGLGQRPHFSLRTLCRALFIASQNPCRNTNRSLYEAFCLSFLTQLDVPSYKYVEDKIRKVFSPHLTNSKKWLEHPIVKPITTKGQFIEVEGYWIFTEQTRKPVSQSNYIVTESFKRHLKDLARIVSLGRSPVLLQGDTGAGKTRIIEYLAELTENKCYRINNHENITIDQYIGTYIVDQSGKLVFREGLLVEAMRHGYWIILDELNLAPTDVLEALNRVLDDNRELRIDETQEVVTAAENFRIFATQNPPGLYGGRKLLSRAFRNRFIELHFNDIPLNELEHILCQRCEVPESYSKKMVAVMNELQLRRRVTATFAGKRGFMTLRDLFRWGERYKYARTSTDKFNDWNQHLVEIGYLILAGRVRKPEESKDIVDVMQKIFKRTVDVNNLFSLHENTSYVTKTILEQLLECQITNNHKIVWTFQMRKLAVLVVLALERNEPVLLVGETGGGKTTVCQILAEIRKQQLICVNCHMNTESADFIGGLRPAVNQEEGRLFEWCDGPLLQAMQSGSLFLVDEINLVEHSTLERLNSLLESDRSLLVIEKGDEFEVVCAQNDFQFVGTMNPGGDYGKKELSPALRNRFTEIWCEVGFNREDFELIIVEHLDPICLNLEIRRSLATRLLDFIEWFKMTQIGSKFVVSIRDILTWVSFINSCPALTSDQSVFHGACLTFFDSFGSGATSLDSQPVLESFYIQCLKKLNVFDLATQDVRVVDSNDQFGIPPFIMKKGEYNRDGGRSTNIRSNLDAKTILENFLKLLRAMQLRKAILLEGDPGVGKTRLISFAAELTRHQLVRINVSRETEFSDLIGAYYPKEDGKSGEFVWKDGLFLRALKDGAWILIDELNLASQSVLEGLNACLDHRAEVFVPEIGKSFPVKPGTRIFACQNPLKQGSARKGLPKSFLNRFTQVYVNRLSDTDFNRILNSQFPEIPNNIVVKMVEFNSKIVKSVSRNEFGTCGSPWEFNLRDLIRWCEALMFHKKHNLSFDFNPSATINFIYCDRMRLLNDRKAVENIFYQVFNTCVSGVDPLFELTDDYLKLGDVFLKRFQNMENMFDNDSTSLVLRSQLTSLRSLMFAVNLNWMAILIGPSDARKKNLIEMLAKLVGCDLKIVSMYSAMDITDLLGGYEQSDYNRKLDQISAKVKELVWNATRTAISNISIHSVEIGVIKLLQKWEKFLKFLQNDRNKKIVSFIDQISLFEKQIRLLKQVVQCAAKISVPSEDLVNNLDSLTNEINQQKRNRQLNSSGGKFEWIDSLLIKSLQKGNWLLIENANFCNAAIFDRLNCLLEPNGTLIVNERGTDEKSDEIITIKPHPNFRLFLTMDPKYGEISRAMRNRGVEIFMHPIEIDDEQNLDIEALLSFNGLQVLEHQNVLRKVHAFFSNLNTAVDKPNLMHLLRSAALISQQCRYNFGFEKSFKLAVQEIYTMDRGEFSTTLTEIDKQLSLMNETKTVLFSSPAIEVSMYHNNTQVISSNSFNLEKLLNETQNRCSTELLMNMFLNGYHVSYWNELSLNCGFKNLLLLRHNREIDWRHFNVAISQFLQNFAEKYGDFIEPRWFLGQLEKVPESNNMINTLLLQLRIKAISLLEENNDNVKINPTTSSCTNYSLLEFSEIALSNKISTQSITKSQLVINYKSILKYSKEYLLTFRQIDDNNSLIVLFIITEWWRIFADLSRMKIFDNFEQNFATLFVTFKCFRKVLQSFTHHELDRNFVQILYTVDNDLKNFDDFSEIEIVKNYWKYLPRSLPIVSFEEMTFLETCDVFIDRVSVCKLSLGQLYKIFDDRNLFGSLMELKIRKNLHQVDNIIKQLYSEEPETIPENETSYTNILCIIDYFLMQLLSNIRKDFNAIKDIHIMEILKKYLFNINLQHLLHNWQPHINRNQLSMEVMEYYQNSISVKNLENVHLNPYNPTLMYNLTRWMVIKCQYGQWQFYQEKLNLLTSLSWEIMAVFQDENYDLMKNDYDYIMKSCKLFLNNLLNDPAVVMETTEVTEIIDLIEKKLCDANYNQNLITLLHNLKCELAEGSKSRHLKNLASIYAITNYLKLQLNCQLPIIDPLIKTNVKKSSLSRVVNNLYSLKTSIELQHQQLCNYSEIRYPLYKPLIANITKLDSKLVKISNKDCRRLQSTKTYQNLLIEIREHLKSMGLIQDFLQLLNFESLPASILINKCESWINAQYRFRRKLSPFQYVYCDLIEPILEASTHFSYGLKLLKSAYVKLSERQTIEDKYAVNLPQFLLKLIEFPMRNSDYLTRLCFESKFRQLFIDHEFRGGVIGILKSNLWSVSNNFLVHCGVNDKSLLIRLFYLINKFVEMWNKQELSKRIKIAEDQSLYKVKMVKLDAIPEDDNSEEEIKEFFTNYLEQDFQDFYIDHLNDPNTDDNDLEKDVRNALRPPIKSDNELNETDFELMCKLHVKLMLSFTNTKWFKNIPIRLKVDFYKPLLVRYEVFKVFLDKFITILDHNLDQDAIMGYNLLLMGFAQSIEFDNDSDDIYDFYKNPNVSCVNVALDTLKKLRNEVLRLLVLYPEQPTLSQILVIINRIESFTLDSSIARFLTGFEILLSKWFEWCENSPRDLFKDEINADLTKIVIDWRKLELANWKNSLNIARKKLADKAYKLWVNMYNLMVEFIKSKKYSKQQLIEILQRFMESANLAEFETRLNILLAFHCHVTHYKSSKEQSIFSTITWNIFEYYRQYLRIVQSKCYDLQKPIEKKLKEYVNICKWNDINYWAVKNTIDKTHRTLHKFIKEFENVLKQQIKPFLVIEKSDSQTKGPKLIIPKLILPLIDCDVQYVKRARQLLANVLKELPNRTYCDNLNTYVDTMIETVNHLSGLEISADLEKTKRTSLAKSMLQQKKQCLADFFKTMVQLGLSYRRGLVQKQKQSQESIDFLQKPCDLTAFYDCYLKGSLDKQLYDLWLNSKDYYMKCVSKLIKFETIAVCNKPPPDFGAQNLERCIGFAFDLMVSVQQQKRELTKNINTMYKLKDLETYFQSLEERWFDGNFLIISSRNFQHLSNVLNDIKSVVKQYCALYDNYVIEKHSDFEIKKLPPPTNLNFSKILDLCDLRPGLVTNLKLIDYNFIENKHDFIEQIDGLIHELKIIENSLQDYNSMKVLSDLNLELGNLKVDIVNYSLSKFKCLDPNFGHIIDKCVRKILLKVQKIYKNCNFEQNNGNNEFENDHLTKSMIGSMQLLTKTFNIEHFVKNFEHIFQKFYKSPNEMITYRSKVLEMKPYFDIIVSFYKIVIGEQICNYRLSCKMLSFMLNVFHEFATNGFCVPKDIDLQEIDNDDMSGMGLVDGTGDKDVSDQIESQDQLDEAKPQKGPNDKTDDDDDQDDELGDDQGGGIDMDEDFDGQMENLPDKDDEDNEKDEQSDKEDDLDQEMGDVDDASEKLDEKIWDDDDDQDKDSDDNQENENDKVDKDCKKGQKDKKNNHDNQNDDSQMVEENVDYDPNEVDPYQANENQYPEPEVFDIPETMDIDDNDKNEFENDDEGEGDVSGADDDQQDDDNVKDDCDVNDAEELQPQPEPEIEPEDNAEQKSEIETGNLDENVPENQENDNDNDMDVEVNETNIPENVEVPPDNVNSNTITDQETTSDQNNADGQCLTEACELGVEQGYDQIQPKSIPDPENTDKNKNDNNSEKEKQKLTKSNKKRTLGSKDEPIKKRAKVQESDKGGEKDINKPNNEFQHINDQEAALDCDQILDGADQEQFEKQKVTNDDLTETNETNEDNNMIEDSDHDNNESEMIPKEIPPSAIKSLTKESKKSIGIDDESDEDSQTILNGDDDDREFIKTDWVARGDQSTYHTQMDRLNDQSKPEDFDVEQIKDLRLSLEQQLINLTEHPISNEAEQMWSKFSAMTNNLAQNLSEQLRLVLEPMQASKLEGDYRTGRRINMRKIIPYIASNFRKDKIWLRRTKPFKRDYSIILAIDDSFSMDDNKTKEMTFESVALISKALNLLESGRLSILSYGEQAEVLHKLHDQFTDGTGAKLLQKLQFKQKKTLIGQLVNFVTNYFNTDATMNCDNGANSKLLVVISDGRGIFSEGKQYVQKTISRAKAANIFIVFVIIDNPNNESSILDLRTASFASNGSVTLKSYLDEFPFPFYVILRNIESLPYVLSEALKQWFELIGKQYMPTFVEPLEWNIYLKSAAVRHHGPPHYSYLMMHLQIVYGTETGNCAEIAERLWRSIDANFTELKCEISSIDQFEVQCLIEENFVIFICSTTNEGDEPTSMRSFWRFLLRRSLPSDSLSSLSYVILGLGDSSYSKFNFAAKRLHKRLLQLGANSLLRPHYADDQHEYGYDSVAIQWIDEVLKVVTTFFMLPLRAFLREHEIRLKEKWSFKKLPDITFPEMKDFIYFDTSPKSLFVRVANNQRVTAADHFQNVVLIRFEADKGADLIYKPGDVLNIRPWNSKEHISQFFQILENNELIDKDATYIFNHTNGPKVPEILMRPISFYKLCEEFWDLNAIPRRHTFRVLASVTQSPLEKEKLLEFCSAEGLDDLYDYCNRPRRTILEVLNDFPHAIAQLTINQLFDFMPSIKPRSFSIASSQKVHGDCIVEILVAVVRFKTKLKKDRFGLCSNWLAALNVGSKVPVWITRGSFNFPKLQNATNIIMVGPGTGVAPFRSFILERIFDQQNVKKKDKMLLFFGCRNQAYDFFIKDDLNDSNDGTFRLICAFSRDQENKIYVQHKISESDLFVWQMMKDSDKVNIFVAGNAKNMPKDVREAFINVASKYMESKIEGEKFVGNLEKLNKYQNETWP